jgi:ABC-type polysaccharide transport system permease subunit
MTQTQTGAKAVRPKRTSETVLLLRRNWDLYLLLFPALAYIVLFHYVPLYGVQIAFRNYNPYDGILGSPWVGFEHFTRFFQSAQFWNLLRNTLGLSFYSLLAGFPIPILLALMLNHCASRKFQKTTQMISYIPHFYLGCGTGGHLAGQVPGARRSGEYCAE